MLTSCGVVQPEKRWLQRFVPSQNVLNDHFPALLLQPAWYRCTACGCCHCWFRKEFYVSHRQGCMYCKEARMHHQMQMPRPFAEQSFNFHNRNGMVHLNGSLSGQKRQVGAKLGS